MFLFIYKRRHGRKHPRWLDISQVPDNPRIRNITHALPEGRRPGMVLFDQGNNSSGSSGDQPLFDRSHENTGDPPPPKIGMDNQPVNVSPPTIERANDGTDNLPTRLSRED